MQNRGQQVLRQTITSVQNSQLAKDQRPLLNNPLGLKKHVPLGGHYEYWYHFIRIGWASGILRSMGIALIVLYGGMFFVHGATVSFGKYGTALWLMAAAIAGLSTIFTNHHGESLNIAKHRIFYPFIVIGGQIINICAAICTGFYLFKVLPDLGSCGAIRANPSSWSTITQILSGFGLLSPAMCLPDNFGILLVNFLITCAICVIHLGIVATAVAKLVMMWTMYSTIDNDTTDPDTGVIRSLIAVPDAKTVSYLDALQPLGIEN